MHHLSVSWHIIPLKFSNWNIICFWEKEPINVQLFRIFSVLMKVHPIPRAIFETTRPKFIQILYHCSMSWKITPLYFLSSSLIYFGQKWPIKVKLLDFWLFGWKFTKSFMSYLKPQVFSLNFASLFCTFLAGTLYDFYKRRSSKCKISEKFQLLRWNFNKFVLW